MEGPSFPHVHDWSRGYIQKEQAVVKPEIGLKRHPMTWRALYISPYLTPPAASGHGVVVVVVVVVVIVIVIVIAIVIVSFGVGRRPGAYIRPKFSST